jgi:proline racemase
MRFDKTVSVVGAHAEGEVGNVIVGGVIDVPGASAFEKMEFLRDRQDSLRRSILFEPRGSVSQAVNVLLPPSHPEADLAFVIMEATKYPATSGSNAMCVATVVLETGIRPMREPETTLVLEAPGGLIEARCTCRNGKVERVRLRMLPSFVLERDILLELPGYGTVQIVVAYGGIFYAIVPAAALGLDLVADAAARIVKAGIAVREAANRACAAVHPENAKVRGIANVIVAGEVEDRANGLRETVSATVIGNGRLDRSPCGTGISARMALLHEQGVLGINEELLHRSIFGTSFHGELTGVARIGDYPAVIAEISGQAWITGHSQLFISSDDPLAEGHCPNDVWLTAG